MWSAIGQQTCFFRSSSHCNYVIVKETSSNLWRFLEQLEMLLKEVDKETLPFIIDLLDCETFEPHSLTTLCELGKSAIRRGQTMLYLFNSERHPEILIKTLEQNGLLGIDAFSHEVR